MLELVVRPRARADLKGIWKYSFEQWGASQADSYLRDIAREIQGLLRFPELGTSYDHVRPGYRALHVKRHLVFYRFHGDRLELVRVLHETMNVESHL
jgi:toxin ParE1/3/4